MVSLSTESGDIIYQMPESQGMWEIEASGFIWVGLGYAGKKWTFFVLFHLATIRISNMKGIEFRLQKTITEIETILIRPKIKPTLDIFYMNLTRFNIEALKIAQSIIHEIISEKHIPGLFNKMLDKVLLAIKNKPQADEDSEQEVAGEKDQIANYLNCRKPINETKHLGKLNSYLDDMEKKEKDRNLFIEHFSKSSRNQLTKRVHHYHQSTQTDLVWVAGLTTVNSLDGGLEEVVENFPEFQVYLQHKTNEIMAKVEIAKKSEEEEIMRQEANEKTDGQKSIETEKKEKQSSKQLLHKQNSVSLKGKKKKVKRNSLPINAAITKKIQKQSPMKSLNEDSQKRKQASIKEVPKGSKTELQKDSQNIMKDAENTLNELSKDEGPQNWSKEDSIYQDSSDRNMEKVNYIHRRRQGTENLASDAFRFSRIEEQDIEQITNNEQNIKDIPSAGQNKSIPTSNIPTSEKKASTKIIPDKKLESIHINKSAIKSEVVTLREDRYPNDNEKNKLLINNSLNHGYSHRLSQDKEIREDMSEDIDVDRVDRVDGDQKEKYKIQAIQERKKIVLETRRDINGESQDVKNHSTHQSTMKVSWHRKKAHLSSCEQRAPQIQDKGPNISVERTNHTKTIYQQSKNRTFQKQCYSNLPSIHKSSKWQLSKSESNELVDADHEQDKDKEKENDKGKDDEIVENLLKSNEKVLITERDCNIYLDDTNVARSDIIIMNKISELQSRHRAAGFSYSQLNQSNDRIRFYLEIAEKLHRRICGQSCKHLQRYYKMLKNWSGYQKRIPIHLATSKIEFY